MVIKTDNTKGRKCKWYNYTMECKNCWKTLKPYQKKFCSNRCQQETQFVSYISDWKLGNRDGNRGKKVRLVSKHVRRYLLQKYKHSCCICGWSKLHPVSGHSPLEINHIDGNPENTTEANLQLLCPNCHSLTETFRNLNRGNGRTWRKRYHLP